MSTLPSRSLPTRSYPATMSTLPSRSLATELSPSYFSVPRLGPTVFQDNSIDGNCPEKPAPPALHFCIAPSQPSPPQAISTLHNPCTLVRRSLQRSSPQSYFHASHSIHPVSLPSVRRSRLAPCSGASPKLFLRFAVHPCAPSSLPPAELPLSYFIHASQSIHAGPALPSRSLQRRSPEAISKLFPRFPLRPRSCLPSFLSSFLPAFLPSPFPSCLLSSSFLPSFVPSLLVRLFCLAPLAAKEAKREPKHRRCVWEKAIKKQCFAHFAPIKSHPWCCSSSAIYTHWVTIRQRITTNRREGAWMLC